VPPDMHPEDKNKKLECTGESGGEI